MQHDEPASRAHTLLGEVLRREREGDPYELVSLREEFSRPHEGLVGPTWRRGKSAAPVIGSGLLAQ
jgi:hypothetical protein